MNSNTYYLSSNTSEGYVSFFDSAVSGFKKIIVLKNISAKTKNKLFFSVKTKLLSMDICFDTILRAGTASEIDAIIIPILSCAIASEELFLKDIPLYSDVIDFIEMPHYDSQVHLCIKNIKNMIDFQKSRMYIHLNEAKKIHDKLEKIYISAMDFKKLNTEINTLISNLLNDIEPIHRTGDVYKRFFGTLHPRENINYIDDLSKKIVNRIFIKGRPGSGKSTFLKKLATAVCEKGYDVEAYYCSLDPKSFDMVIARNLGICVFDSTAPHEKFPVNEGDREVDIYNLSSTIDADKMYNEEIMYISNIYNIEIKKAKECLYSSFVHEKRLEKIFDENLCKKNIDKVIKIIVS